MKRGRIISLLLAASLVISALMGCGQKEVSEEITKEESTIEKSETSADAAGEEHEPVKYTIMLRLGIAEYPADGGEAKKEILKKLEEDLGIDYVDFEVILAAGQDYTTKLNAMLADGDIPDYFEIDDVMFDNLVKNGVIAPLDDLIANEMPNLLEAAKADVIASNTMDLFTVEGKRYGIPTPVTLPGGKIRVNTNGMIMRTDWLEKVGEKVPETLDELHTVLQKFTFEDPDGNGQDDTYGLGGDKANCFASIFGAYGVCMDNLSSWAEKDGKLVHSTTLPEVKDALATLQTWYAEGLIDPDKFVVEGKQTKDKFAAGKIGVYENSLWWANDARVAWAGSGQADATCALITPVKGPGGKQGYPVNSAKKNARVISSKCKDPETLAKILNWMMDDTEKGGLRLVTYGIEGVHYTYDEATDTIDQSLIGDTALLYELGYNAPVRWANVTDHRWLPVGDPRLSDYDTVNDMSAWVSSAYVDTVPAMTEFPDLYSRLWMGYFVKIVTGDLPVDAFDEYVTKFYEQGGQEMTDQVNEAWAAQK